MNQTAGTVPLLLKLNQDIMPLYFGIFEEKSQHRYSKHFCLYMYENRFSHILFRWDLSEIKRYCSNYQELSENQYFCLLFEGSPDMTLFICFVLK